MDKWEYKVVGLELKGVWAKNREQEEWEKLLNELGDQGWELVAFAMAGLQYPKALLKRKK